jgi:2-C-methyl-D-erythritol 2,4-cyclodiphosphate synthase
MVGFGYDSHRLAEGESLILGSIILERPKLKDYKQAIREGIAELCEIPSERVNIKAKTNEKMGFVGRLEGVAVYCVCEIQALDNKQ